MKKDFSAFKNFIRDKKVGVVGLGVSNIPLMEFLLKMGAKVYGFDRSPLENLPPLVREMKDQVVLHLGEDYLSHLAGLHVIFKTPGMRPDHPALLEAEKEGAVVTSEMEEFLKYTKGRTIGITGSDGKTTTTTVVGELLKAVGHSVYVGGNIGTPLFTKVEEITEKDFVVLELSSFQLMTMTVSPETAVVTNLTPNHLDVHKDMEEYAEAKKNIFRFQNKGDLLILNEDNEVTHSFKSLAVGEIKTFSSKNDNTDAYYKDGILYLHEEPVVSLSELKVKGVHNAENFLAAFLAVEKWVPVPVMKKVALAFEGVKHRCQFIRELNGVRYYNDSIASSPVRTLATISSFEKKVNIILGGYDKHLDFAVLAENAHLYVKGAVLVGATKEKIHQAFVDTKKKNGVEIPLFFAENFDDAVLKLKEISEPGDFSLLSPACASFDEFKNFEVRGDRFVELVNNF